MCSEHDAALAVCWFESNYLKLNTDKCNFIISGNKYESLWADIGNDNMRIKLCQASWNKYRQKLEI